VNPKLNNTLDMNASSYMTDEDYLDYTIKVFQPRYSKSLTREDARAISDLAVRFYGALEDLRKSNQVDEKQPTVLDENES